MSTEAPKSEIESVLNEDEIFKSLSHQLRRNILKVVGAQKTITFTEIKNKIVSIDSPTLAYHLKSLKYLLDQKDNLYTLTDLGITALLLINKIDQTQTLQKSRKTFIIANLFTTISWTVLQIIVTNLIWPYIDPVLAWTIVILFVIFIQVNAKIIWQLYATGYGLTKKKRNKMIRSSDERPMEK